MVLYVHVLVIIISYLGILPYCVCICTRRQGRRNRSGKSYLSQTTFPPALDFFIFMCVSSFYYITTRSLQVNR